MIVKNLEKCVISGSLENKELFKSLSQKEINHLLHFAYENNKFNIFHELLPYWNTLDFNNGDNLMNSLVDRFMIKEAALIKVLKDITVENEVLNFYQNSLNGLQEINPKIKEFVSDLTNLLDYKIKKNLSDKLESNLLANEQTRKMVKI